MRTLFKRAIQTFAAGSESAKAAASFSCSQTFFGNPTQDRTLNWRRWLRRSCAIAAALFISWYLICKWSSFGFPPWDPGRCYSANHLYYITRHQTAWERLTRSYPHEYGTARLYDRSGKLLYEAKTRMGGGMSGPHWLPESVSMGEDDSGNFWESPLPVPPGDDRMSRDCYPVQIESPPKR